MPYTVYKPGGITDNQFQSYAHLLRQHRFDLGRVRRVPDPATRKRWLPTWDTQVEAAQFAAELAEFYEGFPCEVREVNEHISEGPLGPVLIRFAKQGTGIVFELPVMSRDMILSVYPRQVPLVSHAIVDWEDFDEYKRLRGSFADLVRQLAPAITGLDPSQLSELGFAAADCHADYAQPSAVFFPPRMDPQIPAESVPTSASPGAVNSLAGTG